MSKMTTVRHIGFSVAEEMNTVCQTVFSLSFTGNRLFGVNRGVIFRDNGLARKIYCFNNVVTAAVTIASHDALVTAQIMVFRVCPCN